MTPSYTIRPAVPGDEPELLRLIGELAVYEKLADQAVGTVPMLNRALFGPRPSCEALIAERGGRAVAFALYFTTFSTFGVETYRAIELGDWGVAALNVVSNVVLGLLFVLAGTSLARLLVQTRGGV